MGALVLAAAFSLLGANPAVAQLKSVQGMLSGVVRDTAGTPQLGASVQVIPESAVCIRRGYRVLDQHTGSFSRR